MNERRNTPDGHRDTSSLSSARRRPMPIFVVAAMVSNEIMRRSRASRRRPPNFTVARPAAGRTGPDAHLAPARRAGDLPPTGPGTGSGADTAEPQLENLDRPLRGVRGVPAHSEHRAHWGHERPCDRAPPRLLRAG